jgi:hypothetical protein
MHQKYRTTLPRLALISDLNFTSSRQSCTEPTFLAADAARELPWFFGRIRRTFKMSHDRGWRGSCCSEHET